MSWRGELREQRRERILEAAVAVIARRGYQQATMKEIAAEADIAPGTIYLYFANKRDLLLAIADHLLTAEIDRQLEEMTDLDEVEVLRRLLQQRFAFARANEDFIRALFTAVWSDAEVRSRFFSGIIAPLLAVLENYLQQRVEQGKLRPCQPQVVVPAMAGSFVFFGILRSLAPPAVFPVLPEEDVVAGLVDLYVLGLKPRAEEEGI